MVVTLFFGPAVGRIPVNELAMNFASQRVDDGYLKVLVVAEAVVAKVLRKHPGVRDCFNVAVELNSNSLPHWNAIFHTEEKLVPMSNENGPSDSQGPFSTWASSHSLFLKRARSDKAICRC